MLLIHCSRAGARGGTETVYCLLSSIAITLPNPLRTAQIYGSIVVHKLLSRLMYPLMLGWHGHCFIHPLAVGNMQFPKLRETFYWQVKTHHSL